MVMYKLKPFVNDKPLMDAFEEFLDTKLTRKYEKLSTATGEEVYRLQGEIRFISSLRKIREEVNGGK